MFSGLNQKQTSFGHMWTVFIIKKEIAVAAPALNSGKHVATSERSLNLGDANNYRMRL